MIIMEWYSSLIKKIKKHENNIFVYDLNHLLDDKNFFKELSSIYKIFKYKNDNDYFQFKAFTSDKPKLIYSNKNIRRNFFKNIISISIEDVFPYLNADILENIDVTYFQKIFDYCNQFKSVNPNETQNIIFKSVWGVDLGELYSPTNNLKVALDYLIRNKELDSSILKIISNNLNIDLNLLSNDEYKKYNWFEKLFLNYIDEDPFVHKYDLSDELIQYYLSKIEFKSNVVSDAINEDILVYDPWLIKFKKGISSSNLIEKKVKSKFNEINETLNKIYEDNKIDLNDLDDIFDLSRKFAQIIYLTQTNNLSLHKFDIENYYFKFNKLFKSILDENVYEQLFYYPFNIKPYTVDRILDYINYNFKDESIVLLVMDGMSYDEWFILKEYLDDFDIHEMESFSILPSITSFSRTSIFTGKTPNGFLENNKIKSSTEEKGFINYFNKKISTNDILFGRVDLNNNLIKSRQNNIQFKYLKGYKRIGLICNLFDDESHSINIFGEYKTNLYKNIKNAIESSNLIGLLGQLKESGYIIILTSDHGNVYVKGNGIKPNKMLEFDNGKSTRCLIYDSELLANSFVEENSNMCFKWNYNLLSNNLFLVFSLNGFFGNENSYQITHGGFLPEECIVPVVILK